MSQINFLTKTKVSNVLILTRKFKYLWSELLNFVSNETFLFFSKIKGRKIIWVFFWLLFCQLHEDNLCMECVLLSTESSKTKRAPCFSEQSGVVNSMNFPRFLSIMTTQQKREREDLFLKRFFKILHFYYSIAFLFLQWE